MLVKNLNLLTIHKAQIKLSTVYLTKQNRNNNLAISNSPDVLQDFRASINKIMGVANLILQT